MAGDLNVKAEIEYVLKDQGITAAVSKVKELETAQKKVTEETKRATAASNEFGGAIKSIGQYAASFLAAGVLVSFLRSSVREFVEAEKSSTRLRFALKSLGDEFGDSFKAASAYADKMEELTGIDGDVIRSAQAVLVTIGRLSGATLIRATQAALDLSVALGTDLANAAMIVAKAGSGFEGALGRMGIKIDESIPEGERFEALLKKIEDAAGGAAKEVGDSFVGSVDKATTSWKNFKEEFVRASEGPFSTVLTWITKFISSFNQMGRDLDETAKDLEKFGEAGMRLRSGGTPPPAPKLPAGLQYEVSISLKDAEEKVKRLAEIEEKARKEREKAEAQLNERISESRLAAFKRTVQDELEANGKALEERAKQQEMFDSLNASVFKKLDDRKAVDEEVRQIVIDAAREELAFKQATLDEWLAFERDVINSEVTDAKIKNAKLAALDQDYYRKKATLAELTAQAEQAASFEAASAGMEMLSSIFGENKAFAIAQAIINTAQGVTQAMTLPPPYDAIKAAAVIATGIAQIAKIRSTNLGSSGGAGGGYSGGKGGSNFARTVGSGSGSGASAGSTPPYTQAGGSQSQSTTYDHRVGANIVINGPVVGGRAGVAELYRLLEQERRAQRSRLIR
jgi:hypothetical protein